MWGIEIERNTFVAFKNLKEAFKTNVEAQKRIQFRQNVEAFWHRGSLCQLVESIVVAC